MDERPRFTLTQLLVLVGIVAVAAVIFFPALASSRLAHNERNASASLKTLATAEADFRANDRDWNHVNDFWTGDVKGLYTMTSAAFRGTQDPPIRLIELSIATADADGTFLPAAGENLPLSRFGTPSPKAGYWYAALRHDLTLAGSPEMTYRTETGGPIPMGPVHNTSKFGFAAFPDSSSDGGCLFLLNENNTIFRAALTGRALPIEHGSPPGLHVLPPNLLDWPDDGALKSSWGLID